MSSRWEEAIPAKGGLFLRVSQDELEAAILRAALGGVVRSDATLRAASDREEPVFVHPALIHKVIHHRDRPRERELVWIRKGALGGRSIVSVCLDRDLP